MSRQPDTVCSGGCGRKIWRGTGSLPEGRAKCRECRRRDNPRPEPRPFEPELRTCRACGQPFEAQRDSHVYCCNRRPRRANGKSGNRSRNRTRLPGDPRGTRAWRKLRDQVVEEEPECWLRFDVCTGRSQTADHVLTVTERPDLAMERANLRGSCHACNHKRNSTSVSDLDRLRREEPSAVARFFE